MRGAIPLVASLTGLSFAEAVKRRPSINAVGSSRARCEAGNLGAMGCSLAGFIQARLLIRMQGMHPVLM